MPCLRAAFAACLAVASSPVLAQDMIGSFKGTEKLVVSNCGPHDGASTNDWWATHSDLKGTTYAIKGGTSNTSFAGQGELSGNGASTKVSGVDKQGSAWTATATTLVEGDKFSAKSSGRVTGTSCTFKSEIEAVRTP